MALFQKTVEHKYLKQLDAELIIAKYLQRKFNLEELSGKLQGWYLLTYADFIKELGKTNVKLSLSEEAEWEDYFPQESKKALSIKSQVDTTDKEIDRMVYTFMV